MPSDWACNNRDLELYHTTSLILFLPRKGYPEPGTCFSLQTKSDVKLK